MALAALLAADLDAETSENQAAVRNGLEFLRKRGKDGDYRGTTEPQSNLYVQAVVTIALCQGYAYTKDSKLRKEGSRPCNSSWRPRIPKAVAGGMRRAIALAAWHRPVANSWLLTPPGNAGIDANYPASFRGVSYFLGTVTSEDGISVFDDKQATTPNRRLTVVGLACRA